MTMSNQCKWISFFLLSVAVILLLVLFHSLDSRPKCQAAGHYMFKDDGKCYEEMTRGPCPNNLEFMADEKRVYGYCNCPYIHYNRTVLFHHDRCHFIFTKGGCPDGHWLTVNKTGGVICATNTCLQHSKNGFEDDKNSNDDGDEDMKSRDQYDHSMHHTNGHRKEIENQMGEMLPLSNGGECAKLNETMDGCPDGAVVRFHRNFIYPSCSEPPPSVSVSTASISVGSYSSCPLGSYRSIMGKCQPSFEFDFM